jgi:hypothetical protein
MSNTKVFERFVSVLFIIVSGVWANLKMFGGRGRLRAYCKRVVLPLIPARVRNIVTKKKEEDNNESEPKPPSPVAQKGECVVCKEKLREKFFQKIHRHVEIDTAPAS